MQKVYEYTWRNKFLTLDAKTIGDMIDMLSGAVEDLKAMRDAGIVLDGGQWDDYARLVTEDPEVAEKFGLQYFEDDDEEEDEGCCDNCSCGNI